MQSQLPPSSRRKSRGLTSLIVTVVLLVASGFLWLNHQLLLDSYKYWAYQPSSKIAGLSERAGFTDKGKFSFYVTHPEVDDRQTFNSHCDRREKSTAILGCYVNDKIHIFDVTDKRLDGIREVTSAHEMLHAVYQRLSRDEKIAVNKLVEAEYEKVKDNPAFSERMEFYARTEPGERNNELHSIIATEVRTISSELEAYYAKYFKDRDIVLAHYDSYNSVLTSLNSQGKEILRKMEAISTLLDSQTSKYNQLSKQLQADIIAFNRRVENGDISSVSQFNNEKQQLIQRAENLEQMRLLINQKTNEYEQLRIEYNNTVLKTREIRQSLDSNLAPAPKV